MTVKIQINSLEALERLIGNDNELEVQIRSSIVQEFSKRHLKSIVNNTLIEKLEKDLKQFIIQNIETFILENLGEIKNTNHSWTEPKKIKFHPHVLETIYNKCKEIADLILKNIIDKRMTESEDRILNEFGPNIDGIITEKAVKEMEERTIKKFINILKDIDANRYKIING